MMIKKLAMPRRTFLRGIGATVALPLLDAMVPSMTAFAKTPAKPKAGARAKLTIPVPTSITATMEPPPSLLPRDNFEPLLSTGNDVLAFRVSRVHARPLRAW